jgi:hypothetical protein
MRSLEPPSRTGSCSQRANALCDRAKDDDAADDNNFVVDHHIDALRRLGSTNPAAGSHVGSARHDDDDFSHGRRYYNDNQDHDYDSNGDHINRMCRLRYC